MTYLLIPFVVAVRGNKRPLSSSSPFIIEDSEGRFRYGGGSAGGSRIISCNVQQARNFMVCNTVISLGPSLKVICQDYGMNLSDALSHPRLHDQIAPDETHLENGRFDDKFAVELNKMGHKVKWIPSKNRALLISGETHFLAEAESVGCGVSYDPETGVYQAEGEPRLAASGGSVV